MRGDLKWQNQAACLEADPNIFFPERNDVKAAQEAMMFCMRCPVFVECKQYKNDTGSKHGIWAAEFSKRGEA